MISFRNVSYTYPNSGKKILDDVSFDVAKGDFAVLKGMTGSGKSTILELLTCQAMPSAGHIESGGTELSNLSKKYIPKYRRSIGCVFQDFKLLEEKTAAENVAFALEVQRKYKPHLIREKTNEVLVRTGIIDEGNRFPRELSEGSRQRVAIARALVSEPLLLLADGAASGLDDESAQSIIELLVSENIRGMTILLTTATTRFFPVFPRSAVYFELSAGTVHKFMPVSKE
jgi:cell division transport system ATP-binding protein